MGIGKDAPFQRQYQYTLASNKKIVNETTTTVPEVAVHSGDEG